MVIFYGYVSLPEGSPMSNGPPAPPRKATCDKKASAFKVRQQTRKEVPRLPRCRGANQWGLWNFSKDPGNI